MGGSEDLRSDIFQSEEKTAKSDNQIAPEALPPSNPASPGNSFAAWIIGLTAPLLIVCMCGAAGYFIFNSSANRELNVKSFANQISADLTPVNDHGTLETTGQPSNVTILDGDTAMEKLGPMDGSILSLEENSKESYPDEDYVQMGRTRNYSITLENSTFTSMFVRWCGRNQILVKNNIADMQINVTVDGQPVNVKTNAAWWILNKDENTVCQYIQVVMHNWSEGDHTLSTQIKIKNKINNGLEDIEPGENNGFYKLTVLSSREVPTEPKAK